MATAILNESAVTGNPIPTVVPVEFHGFKIPTVIHDGQPHFAIKPVCEAIGLNFSSQLRNIKRDAVLGVCVVNLTTQMPGDDQSREMAFLPVRFFNGWIFKIDANRYVIKTIRESIIMYQREGYDVLFAYFNHGIAVNPNAIQDAPSGPTLGTLTPSQQQELKELVQAKASAYPDAVKPKVFSQIWTRLQRKFKVPRYSELPVAVFGEARDYVISMQVRSVDAPALPASDKLTTIRDYAWFYPALPDNSQVWRQLSFKAADAFERFGKEIDAIKAEAFRPFKENRRSGVATFLDDAMGPHYALFRIADEQMRTAYRCIYEAMDGLVATYAMLKHG